MAQNNGRMDWDDIVGAQSGGERDHIPSRSRRSTARTSSRSSSTPRGNSSRKGAAASSKKNAPRKKGRWAKRIGLGIVMTILGVFIVGMGGFLYLYNTLAVPAPDDLALAQKTTVYYSDGTTEMGSLGDVNRQIIDTSTLPDYVSKAVVASEDRTFYTNSGIDLRGIARALINNLRGGARQGGSTLTQQYVERYYVGETTSYTGKIKEAVLAVKINREQSKDEVIGSYLNTIYFGRGAYGIEAASQAYFGHPAQELTLSEAAMLAGIIPAPSAWDPAVDEEQARARWQRDLNLLVEDGWVSQADASAAVFPTTIDPDTLNNASMTGTNGYLMAQVRSELVNSGQFDEDRISQGGLRITSTIVKEHQDQAVAAAESMNDVRGWDPIHQHVALSSMDPATGEIIAEYAGADYEVRQQNAVTQDIAMAGSSFKAFALLANARDGGTVNDTYSGRSPQTFPGLPQAVSNNGGYSFGNVSLVRATEYSMNTAFVALNQEVGPANTRQAAVDAGIPEDTLGLNDELLNVLGSASPHNIDLTTAYATIANGGQRVTAHIVKKVEDSNGRLLYSGDVSPVRVFQAEEVTSIMPALEAVTEGNGTASSISAALPRFTTAGKTGTSEDQLSAQFIGFVPGMVTAVSMYQSDDNGNSVPLTNVGGVNEFHGGDWPTEVWTTYMRQATTNLTETDFTWKVNSRRSARNNAPSVAPSATPEATPTPTPTVEETQAPVPSRSEEEEDTPSNGGSGTGTGGSTGGSGTGSGGTGGTGTGGTGTGGSGTGGGTGGSGTGGSGTGGGSGN